MAAATAGWAAAERSGETTLATGGGMWRSGGESAGSGSGASDEAAAGTGDIAAAAGSGTGGAGAGLDPTDTVGDIAEAETGGQ